MSAAPTLPPLRISQSKHTENAFPAYDRESGDRTVSEQASAPSYNNSNVNHYLQTVAVVSLMNFDEDSQDPLINSPRSVEAVKACGLDPKQLVRKPFEHFAKKYGNELAPSRAVKYEKRRALYLSDVRTYREALIQAQEKKSSRSTSTQRHVLSHGNMADVGTEITESSAALTPDIIVRKSAKAHKLNSAHVSPEKSGAQVAVTASPNKVANSGPVAYDTDYSDLNKNTDTSDESAEVLIRRSGESAIAYELRRAETIKRRRIREFRMKIAAEIRRELLEEESRKLEEKRLAEQREREAALVARQAQQQARLAAELAAEREREVEREREAEARAIREAEEAARKAEHDATVAEERRIRAEERLHRRQQDQRRRQALVDQLKLTREQQREEKARQMELQEAERREQQERLRQDQAYKAKELAQQHAQSLQELERSRQREMQERIRLGEEKEKKLRRRQERVARQRAQYVAQSRAEFEARQRSVSMTREKVEHEIRERHEQMLQREQEAEDRREALRREQLESIERSRRAESDKCKDRAKVFNTYEQLNSMRQQRLAQRQQEYEARLEQNRLRAEKERVMNAKLKAELEEERQEHLRMVERMQEYKRQKIHEKIAADRQRVERMEAERRSIRARVATIVKRSEEKDSDDRELIDEMLSQKSLSTSENLSTPETAEPSTRRRNLDPEVIQRVAERLKIPEELAKDIAESVIAPPPRPMRVSTNRTKARQPESYDTSDFEDADEPYEAPRTKSSTQGRPSIPPLRVKSPQEEKRNERFSSSVVEPIVSNNEISKKSSLPINRAIDNQGQRASQVDQSKVTATRKSSAKPKKPRVTSYQTPTEEQWSEVDALEQAQNQYMQRLIAQEEERERDRQSMLSSSEGQVQVRLMAMFQSERQQAAAYLQSVLRQHQLALAVKLEEIGIYEDRPNLSSLART